MTMMTGRMGGGPRKPQLETLEKLMREWLLQTLKPYTIITVPDPQEPSKRRALQILRMAQKSVKGETAISRSEGQAAVSLRRQPFEQWIGGGVVDDEIEVFVLEDPTRIDLMDLTGSNPDVRSTMMRWQRKRSDVDGCHCLHSPVPLGPPMALGSAGIPVLCLLGALTDGGWVSLMEPVQHTAPWAKTFDARSPMRSRAYFQCLLVVEDLVRRGAKPFPSTAPQAFFRALRVSPAKADASQSAATLVELIAESAGDAPTTAALEETVQPRTVKRLRLTRDDEFGGGEDFHGNLESVATSSAAPVAPAAAASASSGSDSSSSDSSSSSGSDSAPGSPGAALEDVEFGGYSDDDEEEQAEGMVIMGMPVTKKTRRGGQEEGLEVACRNPAHGPACVKYRSLSMFANELGPRAAHLYLDVAGWRVCPVQRRAQGLEALVGTDPRFHGQVGVCVSLLFRILHDVLLTEWPAIRICAECLKVLLPSLVETRKD